MIERYGKRVLTTIDEIVDPRHSALLVVDMQNDFCAPDGLFARQGADVSAYAPIVPRIRALVDAARAAGAMIVFVQATTLPGGASQSPTQLLFERRLQESHARADDEPFEFCLPGTPGWQVLDELDHRPEDLSIQKHRSSAFAGTSLDMLLRSNGIATAIVTGCTTEGCIDSTLRDAGFHDYYPVGVRDCIASDSAELHAASMVILEAYRALMWDADEIAGAWKRSADEPEGGAR